MTGRLVNYHSSSPNLLLIFTVFMALILRGISLIKNPKIGVFELFSSEINCNFLGSQKSTFENDPVLPF